MVGLAWVGDGACADGSIPEEEASTASSTPPGDPVDNSKLLQEELDALKERGITRADLMRIVVESDSRLRMAHRTQPGLFSNAPLPRGVGFGPPTPRREEPPRPTVASSTVNRDWEAAIARDVQCGRDGGLVEIEGSPGMWRCLACEVDVREGNLETHLLSTRHRRGVEARQHQEAVLERHRRGELPVWIELRDGNEYCLLCNSYATEAHLEGMKHQQRVAYHRQYGAAAAAMQELQLAIPGAPPFIHTGEIIAAGILPPAWGDPRLYEWKAETGCFWCKLCWKNADEAHVYSDRHRNRAANPEYYLKDGSLSVPYGIAPPTQPFMIGGFTPAPAAYLPPTGGFGVAIPVAVPAIDAGPAPPPPNWSPNEEREWRRMGYKPGPPPAAASTQPAAQGQSAAGAVQQAPPAEEWQWADPPGECQWERIYVPEQSRYQYRCKQSGAVSWEPPGTPVAEAF